MLLGLDPLYVFLRLAALIPALVGHEFAHGYSAYKMGDPTPEMQGRLTLNPLAHLDPIGTLMIILGPIGWAKPVQVNPYNFKDPARGMMISTAFGPISNLTQGTIVGLILRGVVLVPALRGTILIEYLILLCFINFVLAIFNLIPLGPLDGHHILQYFLPYPAKEQYTRFNDQYGMMVLFGLLMLSWVTPIRVISLLLYPARILFQLVTGGLLA
jgi:Zn-dependent protease